MLSALAGTIRGDKTEGLESFRPERQGPGVPRLGLRLWLGGCAEGKACGPGKHAMERVVQS